MNRRTLVIGSLALAGSAVLPGQIQSKAVATNYYGAIRSQADLKSFSDFLTQNYPRQSLPGLAKMPYERFDQLRAIFEHLTNKKNMTPMLKAWMAERYPHLALSH